MINVRRRVREKIFHGVHSRHLVYNTCWEDPRCDRAMLQMGPDSKVVMLTSAGCNALDYLLDDVAEIHCVDLNAKQNALLDLKKAFFTAGDFSALFDFFGTGGTPHFRAIYQEAVRPYLPAGDFSRSYWDRHIEYFSPRGLRPSFYWHGSSGAAAWLIQRWFKAQPKARHLARRMFEAATLPEQWVWYRSLEPMFLNDFMRWAMQQHAIQSLLGVPESQQRLAAQQYPDGMAGYIRQCLREVFTERPLQDNYFWKLYFWGRYMPDCCPNYLLAAHFDTLQARVDRIATYTMSLNTFLERHPGTYTHFVLLDHQDWLAAHLKPALEKEWELIFQNAAPGAKVLLRTAAPDIGFIPRPFREGISWDKELTAAQHRLDRVGTYAGVWVGTIL